MPVYGVSSVFDAAALTGADGGASLNLSGMGVCFAKADVFFRISSHMFGHGSGSLCTDGGACMKFSSTSIQYRIGAKPLAVDLVANTMLCRILHGEMTLLFRC